MLIMNISTLLYIVFLNYGVYAANERCIIAITVDNAFEAFIDGVLVAQNDETESQTLITVPENSNVLGIHAFNYQGPSGIVVMTDPDTDSRFYTTASEDRLPWRCTEVVGPGFSDAMNPQLIPPEWKTEIDTSWPRAVSVGQWGTERLITGDTFSIQNSAAEWIWTADFGNNEGEDGYKNVFCSVPFTAQCGGRNLTTSSQCAPTATSVVIGTSEYCVEYISPPDNSLGLTWQEASNEALENNGELSDVTNPILQAAAQEEMIEANAQFAWIGGRARYAPPPGPWRWLDACCGLDALTIPNNPGTQEPYAFLRQGCYQDNTQSPDLTGNPFISTDMTVEMCLTQICAGSAYAGIKNGNTCTCSERFGRFGVLPRGDCDTPCSGGGTGCGGTDANSIYAVNGADSVAWHGTEQPNNHNGVDYCGSMRFTRTGGQMMEGRLTDERCREQYMALCEIPSSANCPSGVSGSLFYSLTDGDYTRCFALNGVSASSRVSWYQAREACREDNGDLASLFTESAASSVESWLRGLLGDSLGYDDVRVWVGARREAWHWSYQPQQPLEYTNWADNEPATKDNPDDPYEWECMYIAREDGYRWNAGRCDDQTGGNRYGYIQIKDKPTAVPPSEDTPAPGAASAGASSSSSSNGLKTFEWVLILVLIVIFIVLLLLILAFCCYKNKYGGNFIGPSKYDARPIAPIPTAGNLGEEDSIYTVSESGSTADLFGYGAKSSSRSTKHRINLND